MNAFAGLNK